MKERPESAGIVDWALRQTSMEEVFLRVALTSEVSYTQELEDGGAAARKSAKEKQGSCCPPAGLSKTEPIPNSSVEMQA